MAAPKLLDDTVRRLVEDVPTALAQAIRNPEGAEQILEGLLVARSKLRNLDDSLRNRLVEVAVGHSVGPELRRRLGRESDAMKDDRFFSAIVRDAGHDSESLQFLRELDIERSDDRLWAILQSPSIPVREVGAGRAIDHGRFLLIAAATLVRDGNAEVLRQLAGASGSAPALREARALAEILFASAATSAGAADALEAVGSTPSWLSNEALNPALGPFRFSPYGDIMPVRKSFDRAKMTLLTLIDAMRPDLAVPILLKWRPGPLLGEDVERLRSASGFVAQLVQTQPDIPSHVVAELCDLFRTGVTPFASSSWFRTDPAMSLPGFLFGAFCSVSGSRPSQWRVNLHAWCSYAGVAARHESFLESATASVARKLASIGNWRQAIEVFRAWFERAAGTEQWDGLVAFLAVHHSVLCVDEVWQRVTTEMAAVIAAAAWEDDSTTVLPPRPDLPEILARIAGSPAKNHVRAQALAEARRYQVQLPVIDDVHVLTGALMRSVKDGRFRANEWRYLAELFEHSDEELLTARPSISRVGAAALETAADAGEKAGPVGVERLVGLCFKILATKSDRSFRYHDGMWLRSRVWQENGVRRRQLVDILSKLEADDADRLLAEMPEHLAEQVARSGSTPSRLRGRALLYALNSSTFDPKRCDVSGDPEALARGLEAFQPFECSDFKVTADYLIRASINAFVRFLPSLADMEEQSSPWFRLRERLRGLLISREDSSTFAREHLAERLSGALRDFAKNGMPDGATADASCWIRAAARLQDPRPLSVIREHASELTNAGLGAVVDQAFGNAPQEKLEKNVVVILALRELRKD